MDETLRDLERSVESGDEAARARLVGALLRDGRAEDAWKRARASGELAEVAGRIFEAAGAPFTLTVVAWPLEDRRPASPVRLLGVSADRRETFLGRAWDTDLRLDHVSMPRRCCLVGYRGGMSFRLLDLNGANGTWIGRRRIADEELHDGSVFSPAMPGIDVQFGLGWNGEPWPAVPPRALEGLV